MSFLKALNNNKLHIAGFLFRIGLLIFGEIQDRLLNLKYTDIDYSVYTDAAKYVERDLSPYQRHTYRYTPLLAYMMIPNIRYATWIGKALFCLSDTLCGYMIEKILVQTRKLSPSLISALAAMWVFNPLTLTVSTRGSADTLISFFVLWVIHLLLNRYYVSAAIIYGFVVHFKIYPILYALPMYFFIDKDKKGIGLFARNRMNFAFISAGVFFLLLGVFYLKYGYEFLYETYLYHLIRKDNRHNFSVYFYYIYLNFQQVSKLQSALAFLPQIALVSITGYKFYKDLPFCMFLQTFFFVAFNKVVTAQYFIWYICFIPLILSKNNLFLEKGKGWKLIALGVLWLACELHWNVQGYNFEHKGEDTFLWIWIASLLFFLANIVIAVGLLKNQNIENFKILPPATNILPVEKKKNR